MRLNPGNIWSVLLPIDPGCEFGTVCVPLGTGVLKNVSQNAQHCHVVEPRWSYWFAWYDQITGSEHLGMPGISIAALTEHSFVGHKFTFSEELTKAYGEARKITPFRSPNRGRISLPVITPEIMLLAILSQPNEFGTELLHSGLKPDLLRATLSGPPPTVR
jgi:hypothetical protein